MSEYGSSPEFSLGIEEEFFILKDGKVSPSVQSIMKKVPKCLFSNKIVYHEFHASQIEINSGICQIPEEIRTDLSFLRSLLYEKAKEEGLSLIGIGTHPTANWSDGIINPQYARNLSRRENYQAYLTCGTHVHVSLAREGRAVKVINALRYFLPYLISISANSPYEKGKFTGCSDSRLKILQAAHTRKGHLYAGLPPCLKSIEKWDEFKGSEDIPMYWDIRPNTKYGTVEVRVFDAQPESKNAIALALMTRIMVGMIVKKQLGIPYLTEKELIMARDDAIHQGLRSKIKNVLISKYIKEDLLPEILEHASEYSTCEKDLSPIIKILKSKKNLSDEQVEVFNKSHDLNKVTKEFSRRFVK